MLDPNKKPINVHAREAPAVASARSGVDLAACTPSGNKSANKVRDIKVERVTDRMLASDHIAEIITALSR